MKILITFGLALLAATLAAMFTFLVTSRLRSRPRARLAVFLALAVPALWLTQQYATPRLLARFADREAGRQLLEAPIYRILEKHEPEVYARLLAEYRLVVLDGTRRDDYQQLANAEIASAATRRLANSSDSALLALMRDMLANLRLLRERDPAECYRYLFPQAAGAPHVARFFSPEAQQHTLDLMAEVIRSAAEDAPPIAPPGRAQALLKPVVTAVHAEFGSDAQLLANADAPYADRPKVCRIAVALYEHVMALPDTDAALVIRAMTQS